MDHTELAKEEIRDLAFITIIQNHNIDWIAYHYGKLTSSKFVRAISAINNPNSSYIQHRDDIYAERISTMSTASGGVWITSRWRSMRIRT